MIATATVRTRGGLQTAIWHRKNLRQSTTNKHTGAGQVESRVETNSRASVTIYVILDTHVFLNFLK